MGRVLASPAEFVIPPFLTAVGRGDLNRSAAFSQALQMVGTDAWIAVYIMTNKPYGTLYIGVTSRLLTRVAQHREGRGGGFTAKYGLKRLVWYQSFEVMTNAIHREKQMKVWERQWKINLIESENPNWHDLYLQVTNWPPGPSPV